MNTFTSLTRSAFVVTFLLGVTNALFVPSTASAQVYYSFPQNTTSNNLQNLLPKCTLSANPVLVSSPYTTTLSWFTENASTVSITDVGTVAATGQYTIANIYGTRVFVLTATNAYGTRNCNVTVYGQGYTGTQGGGSVIQQYNPSTGTTGTVENPGCYIAVNPSVIANGTNSTTLSWVGAGALSASISGIGNVTTSGSQSIYPTGSTTYTLTVFGLNNVTRTCSTTVQMASSAGSYYGGAQYGTQYANQYAYPAYSDYSDYSYGQNAYDDLAFYGTPAYQQPQPAYYTGSRGRVPLSRVPYTGPVEDMVAGVFSLSVLVSSIYGTRRLIA
jgi:hypothetical protein